MIRAMGSKTGCRPQYVTKQPDEASRPWEMACEHCGYEISNGWHNGQIVEIEVECPNCRRDLAVLSAFVSLQGDGFAWEVGLGRDRYDAAAYRTIPGAAQSANVSAQHEPETRKFVLVCPGRRCGYRRVVGYGRVRDAIVRTWRTGVHRIVAGVDL
jgi:hypothetical protein